MDVEETGRTEDGPVWVGEIRDEGGGDKDVGPPSPDGSLWYTGLTPTGKVKYFS